jgi:multidrug efflux pump subunit AcrA (membrane-fusion protein)
LGTLWLEVHVPEAHAAMLLQVTGAWFTVEGFEGVMAASRAQVVASGAVLDRDSRTMPLFIEVKNQDGGLRPGMFADVHVATGAPRPAIIVPASAILHENGLPTVYVQRSGEAFERRAVRLGSRDGAAVEVIDGVTAGERVVSRGAWAVRLAASSDVLPSHGHGH